MCVYIFIHLKFFFNLYELHIYMIWLERVLLVKGDQASIVGGAINYVKELEHILQSMGPKRTRTTSTTHDSEGANTSTSSLVGPFSDFFSFPQYSTKSSSEVPESSSSPAEIEVTVAESHANIKILVKKKPRQLLKLIASLQSLRLTLLHLNVTTLHNSILYSISVKVRTFSTSHHYFVCFWGNHEIKVINDCVVHMVSLCWFIFLSLIVGGESLD